jgi:prepilin-type N-terminal cleavage/methylation domain-containing protein
MDIPKLTKAFTLMELLIVIFIVALVYFLGFGAIKWSTNKAKTITPLNLKNSVQNSNYFLGYGRLICLDKCKECYYQADITTQLQPIENKLDLGDDISIYKLDQDDQLSKIEFGRIKDQPICLIVDFYKNGSSTQLILENNKGIYFLSSYFDTSKQVDSLQDAKKQWLKYDRSLHNLGDFY